MIQDFVIYLRYQIKWLKKNMVTLTERTIMKSRSGVYSDTSENRRKHRVGQKYGAEKQPDIDDGFSIPDTLINKFDSKDKIAIKRAIADSKKDGKIRYVFSSPDGDIGISTNSNGMGDELLFTIGKEKTEKKEADPAKELEAVNKVIAAINEGKLNLPAAEVMKLSEKKQKLEAAKKQAEKINSGVKANEEKKNAKEAKETNKKIDEASKQKKYGDMNVEEAKKELLGKDLTVTDIETGKTRTEKITSILEGNVRGHETVMARVEGGGTYPIKQINTGKEWKAWKLSLASETKEPEKKEEPKNKEKSEQKPDKIKKPDHSKLALEQLHKEINELGHILSGRIKDGRRTEDVEKRISDMLKYAPDKVLESTLEAFKKNVNPNPTAKIAAKLTEMEINRRKTEGSTNQTEKKEETPKEEPKSEPKKERVSLSGWESNSLSDVKNYGEKGVVKSMSVQSVPNLKEMKYEYSAAVSASRIAFDESEEFRIDSEKLREKKFASPNEAARAADDFANKWNSKDLKSEPKQSEAEESYSRIKFDDVPNSGKINLKKYLSEKVRKGVDEKWSSIKKIPTENLKKMEKGLVNDLNKNFEAIKKSQRAELLYSIMKVKGELASRGKETQKKE